MKRITIGLLGILVLLVGLSVAATASAEGPTALQVVSVDVNAKNQAKYLEKLAKAQTIFARLDLPAFRMWQSTLAGPNTGGLTIAIEYADMASFAAGQAKLQADAEWQKWLENLRNWDKSTVTSNSILIERTP